jgi:pyridoxamine 5'-phosphate oxidase-like protein
MAVRIGPRLEAFLGEVMPALIGTKRSDGSVQLNLVWFEYRDGRILLNGGENRAWLRHAGKDGGRITLLFVDPKNMWRYAQVQGRIVRTTTEGAGDHINKLSLRYLGRPYQRPTTDRLLIEIVPERITGAGGGQSWDVEPA